ncbi:MAG: hypothetical protein QOG75_3972 [Mycobacterium sp.]|jgi:hypothetical protein|nr:hypothetical protein [Mycobacterium sp.]
MLLRLSMFRHLAWVIVIIHEKPLGGVGDHARR